MSTESDVNLINTLANDYKFIVKMATTDFCGFIGRLEKIKDNNPTVLIGIGIAYYVNKDYENAATYYMKASAISPLGFMRMAEIASIAPNLQLKGESLKTEIVYLHAAFEFAKQLSHVSAGECASVIGNYYMKINDLEIAKSYYEQSASMGYSNAYMKLASILWTRWKNEGGCISQGYHKGISIEGCGIGSSI